MKYKIYFRPDIDEPMKRPDFNGLVPPEKRENMDWCYYIAKFGEEHRDQKSMLKKVDIENPDPGMQYAMMFVPEDFALPVVEGDPENVQIMTETETKAFFETRSRFAEPAERIDNAVIDGLKSKYGFTGDLASVDTSSWSDSEKKALDPEDPTHGIRKNPLATLATLKADQGMTIKAPSKLTLSTAAKTKI